MSKKRNRQPDANGEASDGSTESSQDSNTGRKCLHLSKAMSLNNIKKCTKKTGINAECSVCKKNKAELSKNNEDEIETSDLDVWICLQCGHQGCKQEKHALIHHEKPHSDSHCIAIDIQRWNIWCFKCASEAKLDHRKKTELVEFIKKSLSRSDIPLNSNMALMPAQKEVNNLDKEKEKIYANLPKVMGLRNLGNTCFFNAVLQCLAQTPFIVKVLNELHTPGQKMTFSGGKHKPISDSEEIELPPIEGTLDGWGNFTSVLCQTLKEMQNCTVQRTHNPIDLVGSFKKKALQYIGGGQHDSHELLRHLLELVRNEDLKKYQTIILQKFGFNAKTKPDTVDASTKSQMKFYDNQLNSRLLGAEPVFRGVLVSTLVCLECHHSSQCKEPFLDLSLPVMADKPQPPILKRKNSGLDDTFDITGNNISNAPSKHQLKKERKAARKNRKNKKHENRHASNEESPKENSIIAENGSVLESEESDADVEDNIEVESAFPEVGESGYSSEKASAVASPVSPSSHRMHNQSIATSDPLNVPTECNLLLRPIDNSGPVQLTDETVNNINALNSPSPTDVSKTDIATQMRPSSEVDKSSESLDNENVMNTGFSTALVDYDLTSPDAPTVSPLSSSIASKDSPTSPLCSVLNGDAATEEKVERPLSRLDILETNVYTNKMDNCTGCAAEKEEETVSTCFYNLAQDTEEHTGNANNEKESSLCINDITSGFSRLGISSGVHQSPTRYPTKEEECSIQSCLNQFTALELMSGSNKVGCEECTARERKIKGCSTKMVCTSHTKQYLISRVPAVLILHLKRFQAQRISFRKVMKPVAFSPLLDLAPVCKNNKKPRLYALYGVVEHCGSALHGGHYVAYVKTRLPLAPDDPRWSFLPPRDTKDAAESSDSDSEFEGEAAAKPPSVEPPPGKWYYVSDSRVLEIDESSVLQKQAYLLFYERIL